jgi:spore maturation protein CgeB
MTDYTEHLRVPPLRTYRLSYVSNLEINGTAEFRVNALKRLGHTVEPFNVSHFLRGHRLIEAVRLRYPVAPAVGDINRALLQHVQNTRPEIVFFDKPVFFTPRTFRRIKETGAKIIIYMQDNPFGPRKDGCWLQFHRVHKLADLLCTFREADVSRYESWGLPYIRSMFSYEPSIHFAPPPGWSDKNRDHGVSYIGSPYEDRPAFLIQLGVDHHLPICIAGGNWNKALPHPLMEKYVRNGYLGGKDYREAIWRSKVNISFVTKLNEDDIAHKSIEIAACGGFLLALRTPGHQACFEEDKEAVFFSTIEECAEKARYYLDHPEEREEIARSGHARAIKSGYSNDTQLTNILNYFA